MGHSNVIIVGGGVIGLAIALELQQQGTQVTLLSRDFAAAAGHAAAGMLAPGAEKIVPGPMNDLCQRSLAAYPQWISKLEERTGQDTGYWPCGILAPQLASKAGEQSAAAAHHYQKGLSRRITSADFHPADAQVDNRALMKALRAAVQDSGVDLQEGVCVEGFIQQDNRVLGLRTSAGQKEAEHYILAAGAWSAALLPIPVTPTKGQMLSLRVPVGYGHTQPLQRVLYGEKVYIVPRRDGPHCDWCNG